MKFATFLSPNLEPLYRTTVAYVGERLGIPTELVTGESYEQFAARDVDAGFICGLPYVRLAGAVHPLAAPVVNEARSGGRPVYFSDVVVRRDNPARSFADLRGATWCYNEPNSHSGYMTVLHHLARMNETPAFFARFDPVGFHLESIRRITGGDYDASAIDSHVLAVLRRHDPGALASLRVIDSIGPSTIQPVVAADHVPVDVREAMAVALTEMPRLDDACVERYARVTDADYDDIRRMIATVEAAAA